MIPSCEELAKNLASYEEGTASPVRRWLMRLHLTTCHSCQRYVAQMKRLRDLMSTMKSEDASDERSLQSILRAFREQRFGS
jgi:anti-sigma factor RsiW